MNFKKAALFASFAGLLFLCACSDKIDPQTKAAADAFFMSEKAIPLSQNAQLGFVGLRAPTSFKLNTQLWAASETGKMARHNRKQMKQDDGAKTSELYVGDPKQLNYTGPRTASLSCWFDVKRKTSCLSEQEINGAIEQNTLMVSRYRQLPRYTRYEAMPFVFTGIPSETIWVHQLFLVSLILKAQKTPDVALQEWVDNVRFLKMAMTSRMTMASRSIAVLMIKGAQKALPAILVNAGELTELQYAAVMKALEPLTMQQARFDSAFYAEYNLVGNWWDQYLPGYKVRLYNVMMDYLALASVPAADFERERQKYDRKYARGSSTSNIMWKSIFKKKSLSYDLMIAGMWNSSALIMRMHEIEAENAKLRTFVKDLQQ